MYRPHGLLVIIGLIIAALIGYWLGLRQGSDFGVAFATALRGGGAVGDMQLIRDSRIDMFSQG